MKYLTSPVLTLAPELPPEKYPYVTPSLSAPTAERAKLKLDTVFAAYTPGTCLDCVCIPKEKYIQQEYIIR